MPYLALSPDNDARHLRFASDNFSNDVFRYLEHIEYRCIASGEDYEDVCRLRYNAYVRSDMISRNEKRSLSDKWDGLENCFLFGVYFNDELISTLRVMHLSSETPYSPTMDAFEETLTPRLDKGDQFVDISRFAADTSKAPAPGVVPYLTLRLAVLGAVYFTRTTVLCAIKPDHSVFYRRVFNFSKISEAKTYPNLVVPLILHEAPRDNANVIIRYPFFRSTPMERRMLFGPNRTLGTVPLSVVPTAKYVTQAA